jgi:hypothetical protein
LISINFNDKAMKTNYISCLLIVFLLFSYSCKKELEPQESSGVSIPAPTENAVVAPVLNSGTDANPIQNSPTTQQNSNTLSGMNPPHGQTGHRCDIAIGAPLNSPPNNAKTTSTPVVTNSASNSTLPAVLKPNATPVVTKPGMNPPHGQTGHRCDIAVGAPLSTPVAPTTNSEPNSSPVPAILNPDSSITTPKL